MKGRGSSRAQSSGAAKSSREAEPAAAIKPILLRKWDSEGELVRIMLTRAPDDDFSEDLQRAINAFARALSWGADTWRKPPPHFTPNPQWQRQPQSADEWDRLKDPTGDSAFRAKRRLAFAGDLSDPRAPEGMALVSRWDVINVLSRLTWLEARFENTARSALPPSSEIQAAVSEQRDEGNPAPDEQSKAPQ